MPSKPQPKNTAFPIRLRLARERAGLHQEDVGNMIGLASKGSYNKLERGTREPCMAHLVAIALVLGVSTDYLLGVSQEPPCNP